MLRARLATAAVAIPLLLVLILACPLWMFMALVNVISVLGLAEYASMAFSQRFVERALTIAAGAAVAYAGCFGSAEMTIAATAGTVVLGLTWVLLGREDFDAGLRDLGLSLVGVLYLGVLAPYFAKVHAIPTEGRYLVLLVIAVGMAGDTSGYFVGHAFGRHKLMPRVSPGKTIEGALGIMLGSVAGAAIARLLWLTDWTWERTIGMALVMGVLGQIGDLTESVIKRTFGTKESGSLFPGHGGVLDRIDSLLFPVVFVYYCLTPIG